MNEPLGLILTLLGIVGGFMALQRHINNEVRRQIRETSLRFVTRLREIEPPVAFQDYQNEAFRVIDDIVDPKD